jgi:hypothetical protein
MSVRASRGMDPFSRRGRARLLPSRPEPPGSTAQRELRPSHSSLFLRRSKGQYVGPPLYPLDTALSWPKLAVEGVAGQHKRRGLWPRCKHRSGRRTGGRSGSRGASARPRRSKARVVCAAQGRGAWRAAEHSSSPRAAPRSIPLGGKRAPRACLPPPDAGRRRAREEGRLAFTTTGGPALVFAHKLSGRRAERGAWPVSPLRWGPKAATPRRTP